MLEQCPGLSPCRAGAHISRLRRAGIPAATGHQRPLTASRTLFWCRNRGGPFVQRKGHHGSANMVSSREAAWPHSEQQPPGSDVLPPPGAAPARPSTPTQLWHEQQAQQQQQALLHRVSAWLSRRLAPAWLAVASLLMLLLPRGAFAAAAPPQPGPPPPAAVAAGSATASLAWLQQLRQQQPDARTDAAMRSSGQASTSYAAAAPSRPSLQQKQRQQRQRPHPPAASVSLGTALRGYRQQRAQDVVASKVAAAAQEVMNANVLIKIMALFFTAVPIVWAGGVAYSLVTGAPIQLGLFKIYSVVIRAPGAKVTEETSVPAAALMNLFFLLGMFTFAILIGIVSEEIKNSLKSVRTGNYAVVQANHTVVLGWNQQAPLLLRKIASNGHDCSQTLGRNVVILANEPKEKLEGEVARAVNGSGLNVVTREGTPHFVRDLEAVSAASARTVILLHREDDQEAEVHKVATILGLQTARSHPSTAFPPQRIVLQSPGLEASAAAAGQGLPVAEGEGPAAPAAPMRIIRDSVRGRDMKLVEVNGNRNIARLIAQSAVQPGVATIYSSIAQSIPGMPDLYVCECGEALAGKTYQEARQAFDRAVVCGYIDAASRRTHLNPPDGARLAYADRLIALAPTRADFAARPPGVCEPHAPDMERLRELVATAAPIRHTPKSIVVIGWQGDVADLVTAVQDFGYSGSEITVVSEERPQGLPESGAVSVHWVEGGVLDREAYERAGVAHANSVVLGSVQAEGPRAADARMLASLLIVQDIAAETGGAGPHVVATMQSPETALTAHHILTELGKNRLTAELLQPDEMGAGMILQVANEPALANTLSELTSDSVGTEIYLRRLAPYGLKDCGRPFSFREVAEVARLRGETALGWIEDSRRPDGEMVLAPAHDQLLHYNEDSRLVVLAEDWGTPPAQPLAKELAASAAAAAGKRG